MARSRGANYSTGQKGRFRCAVCGKLIDLDARRCRWDEWGCYYRRDDKHKVMLCSQPCVQIYARQDLEKRAEAVRKTKGWKYHVNRRNGMTCQEAAAAAGIASGGGWSLSAFDDLYWQEIEYLDRMETA